MNLLFLFLDGVGLGANAPARNPLARAAMPNLRALLGGQALTAAAAQTNSSGPRATLKSIDACLGVAGLPQSATGQAALVTGENIPQRIGEHYGPKPNAALRKILKTETLFHHLVAQGQKIGLLNAFPESYFSALQSGKRLPGAIAMTMLAAGVPLKTADDLRNGQALSADFTGHGWHTHLGHTDIPILAPQAAGRRLAALAGGYNLAFFECWLSDILGHRKELQPATRWLEQFDAVLGGLLEAWDDSQGLILITSDHGNLEDLDTRRHTTNPVPALLIGAPAARQDFARRLTDLSDVAPAIEQYLSGPPPLDEGCFQ